MIDELEQLKQAYKAELGKKTDEVQSCLKKLIEVFESGIDAHQSIGSGLETLEHLLHKLAGSSGTYGFSHLSLYCRRMEDLLYEKKIHTLAQDKINFDKLVKVFKTYRSGFAIIAESSCLDQAIPAEFDLERVLSSVESVINKSKAAA